MKIEISIEGLKPFMAEIIDTGSETYKGLIKSLPMTSKVNRWGDEIYFFVDFKAPLEKNARSAMEIGEMAYWPDGPALAIFFGPTPASDGEKPMAASECNVIGIVDSSPSELRKASDSKEIHLRIADDQAEQTG